MLWQSEIIGTKYIALQIDGLADAATQVARVTWQPLNPKTGKPWQAKRDEGLYIGPGALLKAQACYATVVARERAKET